jgi:MFS family permease
VGSSDPDRTAPEHSELPADQLDDEADKEELRQRYYGLLQEMRVVLPGVQVLVAFLLTAPFAGRFEEVDGAGRAAFAVATISAMVAVGCLLTPAVFHRVGDRTRRSVRLTWGIRLSKVGIGCLAVALLAALWCVSRFVYGGGWATAVTAAMAAAFVSMWVVLPLRVGR